MGIWLNDWKNFDIEQLEHAFGLPEKALNDIEIILASYFHGDDTSYAFILFSRHQALFEVNASHDSEVDFSGQWQPEETSYEALQFRLTRGRLGQAEASENVFADELKTILNRELQ